MATILEGNNYLTKEELKYQERMRGYTSVWHSKVDNCIYAGEQTVKGKVTPTYEAKIFDINEYKDAKSLKDAGKLDKDELPYKGWTPEFLPLFTERFQMKEAATMTNAIYSAIDTTTVQRGLLAVEIRQFSIPDAVTTVPTNGLEYNIDQWARFNLATDVPEGQAAFAKHGSVTATAFDLTKDVAHIAATDEATLKARQDIWQAGITNAATDFRRAKSAKIADVLEGASATNVGDWDAFTSGLSDANPLGHINLRLDAIVADNGVPDTIVSHNVGYSAFTGNTFVRGAYNNQRAGIDAQARTTMIDLIPGVTWYIDNELTSDSVIVMDKRGVVNVQGPTRVGQYRSEDSGITGYVARDWYQCQIVVTGWAEELTSVTT